MPTKKVSDKSSTSKTKTRKNLPERENIALWVASGGRCAICNKELLWEEDRGVIINVADKAHIIAHSDDGPRGGVNLSSFGLNAEDLDGIRNLMLLCKNHHKIVDDYPKKFPADKLFKIKKDHESSIKQKLDSQCSSLAVIHRTMEDTPSSINLANSEDILLLGQTEHREKFDDFSLEGWEASKKRTKDFYDQVKADISLNNYAGISIFPLSHIPLLIYLGFLVGDKIPVTTFQYARNENHWICCSPEGKSRFGEVQVSERCKGEKQLIVSISASARVHKEDIQEVLNTDLESFDELHLTTENPIIDNVLYYEEVKLMQTAFKQNVEKLHGENRYEMIYLFAAVPAGLAVEIGRSINANMWCPVSLYNYRFREKPKYQFVFSI